MIAGALAIGLFAPAFLSLAITMLIGLPIMGAISHAAIRPLMSTSASRSSSSSADSFRRQDEKEGSKSNNPVFDALVVKLRDSHIRVVTDWKKAQKIIDELPEQYSVFKGKDSTVYGFVHEGIIYLNPSYDRVDIPIHEYTHLWAEVLRQRNSGEWKNIVSLLKKEKELWKEVKKNYPHLKDDDEIADEVLATFSGRHGAAKLNDPQYRNLKSDGLFEALITALERFWKNVAEFFNMHYENKEDIADRVLSDMLRGVNPLESVVDGKKADARIRTAMEINNNNNSKTVMEDNYPQEERDRLVSKLQQSTKDALLPYLNNPSNEKKRGLIGKILQDPVDGNYWAGSNRDNATVLKLLWHSLDADFQKENQQIDQSIKERVREWSFMNYRENRQYLQKIRDIVAPYADNSETPYIVFLQDPVDVNLDRKTVGIFIEPSQDVDEDAVFIKYQKPSGTGVQLVPYSYNFTNDGVLEHFDHFTTKELSEVYNKVKDMSLRHTIVPITYKENYSRDPLNPKNQPVAFFSKELDNELVEFLEDTQTVDSVVSSGFVQSNNLWKQADYNAFHGALYETSRYLTNRNAIIQTGEQQFDIYFEESSKANINEYLEQSVNLSENGVNAMDKLTKFHGGESKDVADRNDMRHIIFNDRDKAGKFLRDYLNREKLSISIVKDLISSKKHNIAPEDKALLDTYITERGGNDVKDRLQIADKFMNDIMIQMNIPTLADEFTHEQYVSDVLSNIAKNEPYPEIQYHGEEAKQILSKILASAKDNDKGTVYAAYSGSTGMYKDGEKYVAFDNSTNDCWVEEFREEEGAAKWLTTDISAEDIQREEEERLNSSQDNGESATIDDIKGLIKSYEGDEDTEIFFRCEVPIHENKSGEFDNKLNNKENSAPISVGLTYRPCYNAISVLYEHTLAGHSSDFSTILGLDERDLKQEEITSIHKALSADIEKYGKLSPVSITEADGLSDDDEEEEEIEYVVRHSEDLPDERAAEIAEWSDSMEGFTKDYHPWFIEWEDAVRYAVTLSEETYKSLEKRAGHADKEDRYLSDEKINDQYKGYKVNGIKFYKQVQPDAWSGVVDLEFPNADHPDFDSSMCNPFISYDKKGERIAFDNWLPDDVYKPLCDTIRSEHIKYAAVRAFADRVNDMSSHAHYNEEQRMALQDYLEPFGDDKGAKLNAINDLRTAAMDEEDMQNVELKWVDDAQIESNELLDGKVRTDGYGRGF
jgi:hypothetical protein